MMKKAKSQTKRMRSKVAVGICLSCLFVAAAILGLSAAARAQTYTTIDCPINSDRH